MIYFQKKFLMTLILKIKYLSLNNSSADIYFEDGFIVDKYFSKYKKIKLTKYFFRSFK